MNDLLSLEEQLRFAAKYGDRPTFDRLGGTADMWSRMRVAKRIQVAGLKRGIV